MKVAFIIDPIAYLDPTHDSTVAMMEAADRLGHQVYTTTPQTLSVSDGRAAAILHPTHFKSVKLIENCWVADPDWYEVERSEQRFLDEMEVVFMRADPPVDVPYLYTTYILDCIDSRKTLVVNDPNGIRSANEKMFALQFADWMPETIVSRDRDAIRRFTEAQGATVMKPLGGKAGEGILFLQPDDRNINSLVEISTHRGQVPMMVQQFLPAAQAGDKRIILLDGQPIGAVNRIPTGKEFRGNMAVGGRVAATTITKREREMCAAIGPVLQSYGLYFVGIDVIGGYLTEVNVTSPTGIREIDRFNGTALGEQVIEWAAAKNK
jgi:glutathione synthase